MTGQARGVGILALGGYEEDPLRLARAVRFFEGRGCVVQIAPDPQRRYLRFAATDAERVAALDQLLADPSIDVVLALRGGYGMTRLLDRIDFDAVARAINERQLRFVGHSDFTAFHLALLARTGAISFAGPMASYDFGGHGESHALSTFTLDHFDAVMRAPTHRVAFPVDGPNVQVEGCLWGGNLSLVCSLIGTPWMPDVPGGVLFLEGINEQPYRVERMLLQLEQTGILGRQAAILLGDFSLQKQTGYDNGYDQGCVVDYLRQRQRVPVFTGLPFGHCPDKLTLPVGAQVELHALDGRCELLLGGYPSMS